MCIKFKCVLLLHWVTFLVNQERYLSLTLREHVYLYSTVTLYFIIWDVAVYISSGVRQNMDFPIENG